MKMSFNLARRSVRAAVEVNPRTLLLVHTVANEQTVAGIGGDAAIPSRRRSVELVHVGQELALRLARENCRNHDRTSFRVKNGGQKTPSAKPTAATMAARPTLLSWLRSLTHSNEATILLL